MMEKTGEGLSIGREEKRITRKGRIRTNSGGGTVSI